MKLLVLVAVFLFVLWRYAFKPADRTLFQKLPAAASA